MSKDEAMKLALEALDFAAEQIYSEQDDDLIGVARNALRQALKQTDTQKCVLLTPKDSIEDCFNRR